MNSNINKKKKSKLHFNKGQAGGQMLFSTLSATWT